MTMQVFVSGDCTMIAAPVQCDVDGVPNGSQFRKSIAEGVHPRHTTSWARCSGTEANNYGQRAIDFSELTKREQPMGFA